MRDNHVLTERLCKDAEFRHMIQAKLRAAAQYSTWDWRRSPQQIAIELLGGDADVCCASEQDVVELYVQTEMIDTFSRGETNVTVNALLAMLSDSPAHWVAKGNLAKGYDLLLATIGCYEKALELGAGDPSARASLAECYGSLIQGCTPYLAGPIRESGLLADLTVLAEFVESYRRIVRTAGVGSAAPTDLVQLLHSFRATTTGEGATRVMLPPHSFLEALRQHPDYARCLVRGARLSENIKQEAVRRALKRQPVIGSFAHDFVAAEDLFTEMNRIVTERLDDLAGHVRGRLLHCIRTAAPALVNVWEANAFCCSPPGFCHQPGVSLNLCHPFATCQADECSRFDAWFLGVNIGLDALLGTFYAILGTRVAVDQSVFGDAGVWPNAPRCEPACDDRVAQDLLYGALRRELRGEINRFPEIPLSREQLVVAGKLYPIGLGFIVAHEVAHVALGHQRLEPERRLQVDGVAQSVRAEDVPAKNHDREFAADELAFAITLNRVCGERKDHDVLFAVAAVESLFWLIELREKAYAIRGSCTHPKASDRRRRLREVFRLPSWYYHVADVWVDASLGRWTEGFRD